MNEWATLSTYTPRNVNDISCCFFHLDLSIIIQNVILVVVQILYNVLWYVTWSNGTSNNVYVCLWNEYSYLLREVTGTSASSLANLLYIAESQIQDQGLYIVSGLLEYLQYGTQQQMMAQAKIRMITRNMKTATDIPTANSHSATNS